MDQLKPQVNFNVVETIKIVAEKLQNSRLVPEELKMVTRETELLNEYFSLPSRLTWIMVGIFMEQINNYSISFLNLIDFFGMDKIQVVEMKRDIDKLIRNKLIETDDAVRYRKRKLKISRFSFEMSSFVVNAIYDNISIEDSSKSGCMDIFQFCSEVSDMIEGRSNFMYSYFELENDVEQMEKNNCHLPIVKQMLEHNISPENRILIYEMFDDLTEGSSATNLQLTLRDMFDEKKRIIKTINEIKTHNNDLIRKNYISLGQSSYSNEIVVRLTEQILELMAGEDIGLLFVNNKQKNLLKSENIHLKELFFEPKLKSQIDFLQNSLSQEKFTALQERLASNSLSNGVAAVFYGSPGTGKTETAMQIAKLTERDVLLVDISSTKSMWYGESEKIIKEVFDKYKTLCSTSKIKPILLFNEADAVLGKRKASGSSSVSQTENAIQNILLEEMERMDGIMIATTNLVDNLDQAFERRFLFKINFSKPTNEIKSMIWKSKVASLNDDELRQLSEKYNFSGGEIDNVVKKILMEEVLTGEMPKFDKINEFCEHERFARKGDVKRIGY